MSILKSIVKIIAGFGIFEYGYHADDLNVLGNSWEWIIGILIWMTFYILLDVAERID
jgi:hypothetical protein